MSTRTRSFNLTGCLSAAQASRISVALFQRRLDQLSEEAAAQAHREWAARCTGWIDNSRAPLVEHKDAPATRQHTQFALEVKLASDNAGEMIFSGYGAVFDNVDAYGDVIQKGAFADSLAFAKANNQWPVMLLQHGGMGFGSEDMTPIGIWTAMEEDNIGLKIEGKFADTARGREAYALLKMTPRPAIDGLSIGYIPKEWSMRSRPEEPRRTLKKVDLLEVSLVTFPANPKARVQGVKAGLTIRVAEQALRDVGFTQSQAKTILASGYKAIDQRDAEDAECAEALARLTTLLTPGA